MAKKATNGKAPEKTNPTIIRDALTASGGILLLAPTWVPRSFLMPGRRLKLHTDDIYAYGANRGGIDERWFSSTTAAANEGADWDEGLSYVVHDGKKAFTLREAIGSKKANLIGPRHLEANISAGRSTRKFFDNMGPIPHHMHQSAAQAALVDQQGKPESYYFPPQLNAIGNNFPYTFFGLEPGTTKADVRRCLENWNKGDNGILELQQGLSPATRHRLARAALHPACARLAGHL